MGIVGFGRIGQAVAHRASSFGMKVIFYNRSKKSTKDTTQTSLDDLLKISDVITIHLPSTKETKGLFDEEMFAKMEKAPYFVNTSRGDIVVNSALIKALRSGVIKGAALDVVGGEPIGGDHELLSIENCIVIPHIGTATHECRSNMSEIAALNIKVHFDVVERVEKIFANTMQKEFSTSADMYNTTSWDSLKHIMLMSSLEEEFNIEFSHHEVSTMVTGYCIVKGVFRHVFERRVPTTR